MAKYLNSSPSFTVNGLTYEPWTRPALRSDAGIRLKNRPVPSGLKTCWELKTSPGDNLTWSLHLPSCGSCFSFHQDKDHQSRLRKLSTNQQAPYRYRCDTLWKKSSVALSTSSVAAITICDDSPPPTKKRKKASPSTPASPSSLESIEIVRVLNLGLKTPSPTRASRPVSVCREEDDTLTRYLIKRLSIQEALVVDLESEKRILQDKNDVCSATQEETSLLVKEILRQFEESERQVTYLRRLMTRKVDALTLELQVQKQEVLIANLKIDQVETASASSTGALEDLLIEKTLVADLRRELAEAQVNCFPIPESLEDIKYSIEQLVNCTTNKGTHLKTKVRVICEAVLNDVFDGKCLPYLMKKTERLAQSKNPYRCAMNIARILDLSGSVLNLGGYDALRKGMEGDVDGKIIRNGGWLVSKWHVMKSMTKVEELAKEVIPFYPLEPAAGIDGIVFDYPKLLTYILKLFKLDVVASDPTQPPVEFSITLDGADLSRNISHVTAGVKINDPRAIDPVTGIPIGCEDSTKVQSRELCFPFKVLIAKDTKTLYDNYYTDFFSFFKQVEQNGFGAFPRPFIISSPQDMSSFWKVFKKGGACKNKGHFCHCCACHSDVVHLPRQIRCERCVLKGRESCHHYVVGDAETLSRAQERLQGMQATAPYLADAGIKERLLLRLENNQMDQLRDISNINFEPENILERNRFSEEFVNHDLSVLRLSRMGNLEVRRARVKAVLHSFEEAESMAKTIAEGNYAGAYISIRQAVPCILHLENRCGEKFIKMLLLEGYDQKQSDEERKHFLRDFEDLVNTQVLGTPTRRANWRIAQGKDKDNRTCIKDQTLPNTHVRKFINNFPILTACCLGGDGHADRRAKWDETIHLWRAVMEAARRRDDYSEEDIDEFQDLADDWFAGWMKLVGKDGCTNYTHMIASGHIAFYLKEWGNLYKYSQQGWEAYNSLLKGVYYRRTQRGGHGGKRNEPNSRVTPLGRWMQRKLFFLSGNYLACDDI
jgi:hypothetical protein